MNVIEHARDRQSLYEYNIGSGSSKSRVLACGGVYYRHSEIDSMLAKSRSFFDSHDLDESTT